MFIGFGGHTEQRLRAGETADDPASVLEVYLAAVLKTDVIDSRAEFRHPLFREEKLLQLGLALRRHAEVGLGPAGGAVLRGDLGEELGDGFSRNGKHFHEQRRGVNAVLTGDVAAHGHAAGRLAADDRAGLAHLRGDPLEADGDFVALLPQARGDAVEQTGGGVVAHAGAFPAAVLHKIVVEQHEQLVRVDELPFVIDDAETVGVAVSSNAEIAVPVEHERGEGLERIDVRRGQLAAEERIVAVVDDLKIAPARCEQHAQARPAYAVHRVKADAQRGFLDRLHIHGGEDAVEILVHRVTLNDLSLGERGVVIHTLHIGGGELFDLGLNAARYFCVGIAPAFGEYLDAVINGGVVARRHGHAVGHIPALDGEHDERRRARTVDDVGAEAVAREHLARPVRRFLGEKAAVIPDADLRPGVALFFHERAQPCGEQADVLLCEAVGDDGAPSAGTEFDHVYLTPFGL